jgi:hypothetical protein
LATWVPAHITIAQLAISFSIHQRADSQSLIASHQMEPQWDLNPQPILYEKIAPPLSFTCTKLMTGFEPATRSLQRSRSTIELHQRIIKIPSESFYFPLHVSAVQAQSRRAISH